MLFGSDCNAHPNVFNLRKIQFGRYAKHHVQQLRVCKGGIELPGYADYALVTQVFKREIYQIEIYSLQVHPGGSGDFTALFGGIGESGYRIIRREAIELFYRLYFT